MAIASITETLVAHDVEFIVVGGMAAVLQGAPVHTIDLDIVYALSAGYCKKQPGCASHTVAVNSSHGLGVPMHSKSQRHPRVLLQ